MNGHPKSEEHQQMPANKPETVPAKVMDVLLLKADKSAAPLAAMGIAQDKIDAAVKACAKDRMEKIIRQATSYALKISGTEDITPAQLLAEIARQSGIKLTTLKPTIRKNPKKKGGQDG